MQAVPILLLLFTAVIFFHGKQVNATCGYKSCPITKATQINVHLVPHTHDDVGWLKTVDQYYYGKNNEIQNANVKTILDSVVQELLKDSRRKFIYVESSYFFKWYNEQTIDMQKKVKQLVNEGRLEFAGGAWSMNDEAAVHYQSVIDQFTTGLKALSDIFGICGRPRIGWQIDPFGHSREMASLFAQMGYDGQFFARMDWVEKSDRLSNKTGEMIWKASEDLGESSELFTGVLNNHYSAPPGFCFDIKCHDKSIIDGTGSNNNVKERVDAFLQYIENMAKNFRSDHLLVPMGEDFQYEKAERNFNNMDKLITYVNARQLQGSKVNIFYSTPACYLNALHEVTTLTWPNKTQDFFPYSSDSHSYWTGYFTSRPTQKRFERDGNHFLQVAKQLTAFGNLTSAEATDNLDKLRHAMGVMQHHDAITGTEKQKVAHDYDRILSEALQAAQANTRQALQKLTNLTSGEFVSCLQLNISVCDFTSKDANNVVVTLFNPRSQASTQYVRVPVKNGNYEVRDQSGRLVSSQLMVVPKEVIELPFRANDTQLELIFEAYVEKLTSYSIKRTSQPKDVVYVNPSNGMTIPKRFLQKNQAVAKQLEGLAKEKERASGDIIVQNKNIKLTFDGTGHLTNVQMNGISENIRQEFYYYKGTSGSNSVAARRASGAYIFRPNGAEILVSKKATISVYEGTLVKEVHQRFNEWVSQVVRIYDDVNRVEFEWLIGSIPIQDNIGKEVITRFTSSLNNKGVFWTDSNGREMMRRVKNQREYFKPNMTEEVSGNYYPITARIALQNELRRIALLNDRAQGGTSRKDGSLELMLHRRLLRDDAFGVNEALNEIAFGKGLIARGKVYLMLGSVAQKPSFDERLAQQEIHLPFWKFFSSASTATNQKVQTLPSFITLPLTVEMLTLEPYSANEHLLRLENYMDRNETASTTFNLRRIFDALGGEEIRETTLDGNMPLSDMKRFKFQLDGFKPSKPEYYTSKHTPLAAVKKDAASKFNIKLDPMQIRTFIIKWK